MKLSGSAGRSPASRTASAAEPVEVGVRSRLRSLAADGLGCLVTGHVPTERYREETRKLFGGPENPRLRTVLLTCAPTAPDEWFPGDLRADHPGHEVVTLPNVARGRAATATPGGPEEPPQVDDGTLDRDRVEAEILDAVRSVERRRPGVSGPLTFRFGLHRWDVFDHDVPDAPEVLDTVLRAVHDRRGLSHVHYPRHVERGRSPLDDPAVSRLYHGSDELDVVVELRVDSQTGETQHRWRVPDRQLTGWATL